MTDQREGMAGAIYSLHRSESDFVWDADGRGERHPVLCSTRQRFTVHLSPKSWADAEATCQATGGTLANVVSASDNAAVAALFEGADRFWLGASDQADEGVWRWTSSGTLPPTTAPNQAFSDWNPGEPNNYGGAENCLAMWGAQRKWNDVGCGNEYPFACQHRGLPSLSPPSPDNNWRNYVRAPTGANSWNEASVYCTQNHDGLAIINSAEENLRAKDVCGVNSAPALQAVDPQNSCVTSLASVCAQCAGSVSLRRISGTASGNGSWSTNRWVLPTPGPCWTGSMWVA